MRLIFRILLGLPLLTGLVSCFNKNNDDVWDEIAVNAVELPVLGQRTIVFPYDVTMSINDCTNNRLSGKMVSRSVESIGNKKRIFFIEIPFNNIDYKEENSSLVVQSEWQNTTITLFDRSYDKVEDDDCWRDNYSGVVRYVGKIDSRVLHGDRVEGRIEVFICTDDNMYHFIFTRFVVI